MKKVLLPIILAISIITLLACAKQNKSNDRFNNEIDNMSYQALSSIKLLETKNKTINKKLQNKTQVTEKETIDKYLDLMNELLSTNGGIDIKETISDKDKYSKKITITTNTIQGDTSQYLLYYNETKTQTKEEKDEIETITKIEGIAISNTQEYLLIGQIKEEQEKNEIEFETYYKIMEDEQNYVIVKEEYEQEKNEYEQEYKYEIYQNGTKTNSVTFEIEQEKNEQKIKLKESLNIKTIYEFEIKEINKTKYIKIKVFDGANYKYIKVRAVYDLSTNVYTYEYDYINK